MSKRADPTKWMNGSQGMPEGTEVHRNSKKGRFSALPRGGEEGGGGPACLDCKEKVLTKRLSWRKSSIRLPEWGRGHCGLRGKMRACARKGADHVEFLNSEKKGGKIPIFLGRQGIGGKGGFFLQERCGIFRKKRGHFFQTLIRRVFSAQGGTTQLNTRSPCKEKEGISSSKGGNSSMPETTFRTPLRSKWGLEAASRPREKKEKCWRFQSVRSESPLP